MRVGSFPTSEHSWYYRFLQSYALFLLAVTLSYIATLIICRDEIATTWWLSLSNTTSQTVTLAWFSGAPYAGFVLGFFVGCQIALKIGPILLSVITIGVMTFLGYAMGPILVIGFTATFLTTSVGITLMVVSRDLERIDYF